jgi:hypothetical protein
MKMLAHRQLTLHQSPVFPYRGWLECEVQKKPISSLRSSERTSILEPLSQKVGQLMTCLMLKTSNLALQGEIKLIDLNVCIICYPKLSQ